ncbi:YslB family protein [Alkalihalobacillus pseudalcaliphilus]|uniref:YslB family protein n=1 Tax=Alkalihalobacillus pseudalcaliphilus TaxID=79884 RepID=UPI00064DFC60|nr:YslB family protein [Alkalihalobacillus pseudalcaliphilus]KMK74604.1 hypothetical protein AB990_19055 [Alkalihalobacillus pseudalcaliphilus]
MEQETKNEEIEQEQVEQQAPPLFHYDLIRNDLLQELLGTEHENILYWGGKSLARKYALHTFDEIITFFAHAGWGTLEIEKNKATSKTLELSGDWMGKNDSRCYQLEAGFLAQQIEQMQNQMTEATYDIKRKYVVFHIKSDKHDSVS